MGALITVILTVVGVFINYILNGLVLTKLWTWFVVPLGVTPISIPWAIGIATVFSFCTWHESVTKNREIDTVATWVQAFLRPLFALLIGYIAHRLI